jgi:branched-chain amino acid transport system permease protein
MPGLPDLRINRDEWVAEAEGRTARRTGLLGRTAKLADRVPSSVVAAALIALAATVPFISSSGYIAQVALDTALYALLALGLNVVVGWCGLIDLGYVAFYGVGAYAYAMLASTQFNVHLATELAIPAAVAATAIIGLALGATSLRVSGHYLAIVTLFFAQLFTALVITGDRITFPGETHPTNITGGAFGINGVDPINLFGGQFLSVRSYYWFALGVFTVVFAGLRALDHGRVGRSWKSHREDPVAAELMGVPVRRVKLQAFVVGAAIAGLTGTVFAASQGSVFPENFDLSLLVMIYAMVVLGGSGSLRGVVVGAVVVNVLLELLRTPGDARVVFYLLIVGGLALRLRSWRSFGALVAGTIALGYVVLGVATAAGFHNGTIVGGGLAAVLSGWMLIVPPNAAIGPWSYGALVCLGLLVPLVPSRLLRLAACVPLLYLSSFVWENELVQNASVTRLVLLGATLVALMTLRPQGLFGPRRLEIV